jgi:hypothetical protein
VCKVVRRHQDLIGAVVAVPVQDVVPPLDDSADPTVRSEMSEAFQKDPIGTLLSPKLDGVLVKML